MAYSGSGGAYYRTPTTIPTSAGLHSVNTMHMWVRASVVPSTANIRTAMALTGDVGGFFAQDPDDNLYWNHTSAAFSRSRSHKDDSGNYTGAQLASSPSADTWYSWGSTYDGTNSRVYLNGGLEATTAGAAGQSSAIWINFLAYMFSAGGLAAGTQFVEGQGAEIAVWNAALSADEMVSLAKGFRAKLIRPSALQFYSPLVRNLADIRGGRTLVNQAGTDTVTDHPRIIG